MAAALTNMRTLAFTELFAVQLALTCVTEAFIVLSTFRRSLRSECLIPITPAQNFCETYERDVKLL